MAKDCSFQHQALYWVVYFVAIEIQCREDSLFPKVDGINVDCCKPYCTGDCFRSCVFVRNFYNKKEKKREIIMKHLFFENQYIYTTLKLSLVFFMFIVIDILTTETLLDAFNVQVTFVTLPIYPQEFLDKPLAANTNYRYKNSITLSVLFWGYFCSFSFNK